MVEGPDVPPTRVCLERNAQCFKDSIQVPGRKKPLRHLIGWREGFLFLGNQLALDFLNTRPVQNGEPVELLEDFIAVVRWFHAARLLRDHEAANFARRWGKAPLGRRVVEDMRAWREKLRKEVLRWEDGQELHESARDELNRLMAEYPMRTRLKNNGRETSAELYFEPQSPADLFAPLAYSAAMLFASANRERVRKCDQCVLHFLDTSKKGTRRWCSMELCGNRLKVAAYAARKRSVTIRG
jgi:predicted RNA-binding Zn ribbon-like protein